MKKVQKIILGLIPFTGLFAEEAVMAVGKLAAPFGAGFVVIGAGIGIGMLASAAANATPRSESSPLSGASAGAAAPRAARRSGLARSAVGGRGADE